MGREFDPDTRRAELSEAVGRVLLRDGIGGVSLRTVASEAGVALGSLRYVFPTRTDLVVGAARHMVEQARRRLGALRAGLTPREFAEQLARGLLPLTPQTRADLEINVALIAEARAVPELRAVRDEVQTAVRESVEGIVRLLRSQRPYAGPLTRGEETAAGRLHALLDGLALGLLHHDDVDAQWQWRADEAWAIVLEELDRLDQGGGGPGPR